MIKVLMQIFSLQWDGIYQFQPLENYPQIKEWELEKQLLATNRPSSSTIVGM